MPKELRQIGVCSPCRYVTVSGKVPLQAVTSRYVGRSEGLDIWLRISRTERPEEVTGANCGSGASG